MGQGRAKSSVEATRTVVEEKAAAVQAIESSIREAEEALAAAEEVVRGYADERGSLDDQVLELGAELFRDRVAEADRKVHEATIDAGGHRASIVAYGKQLEQAQAELLRAEADAAEATWREAAARVPELSAELARQLAHVVETAERLAEARERRSEAAKAVNAAYEAAGLEPPEDEAAWDETEFRPAAWFRSQEDTTAPKWQKPAGPPWRQEKGGALRSLLEEGPRRPGEKLAEARARAEAAKENARRKRIHDLALVQFVVDEGRWPPQQKAAAEIAALSDEDRAEFDAALARIREGRQAERAGMAEKAARMGYAYMPEGGIGAVEFPEPVPMPPAA